MLSIHAHIHAAVQRLKEKKAGRHQHIGEDLHNLWDVVKIVTYVKAHRFNQCLWFSMQTNGASFESLMLLRETLTLPQWC